MESSTLSAPFGASYWTAVQNGQYARVDGVPLRRNPYDAAVYPDLHKGWLQGWHETDEEFTLLNLAAVAQDLLEQAVEHSPGKFTIDTHLFSVFRRAAEDAGRFV